MIEIIRRAFKNRPISGGLFAFFMALAIIIPVAAAFTGPDLAAPDGRGEMNVTPPESCSSGGPGYFDYWKDQVGGLYGIFCNYQWDSCGPGPNNPPSCYAAASAGTTSCTELDNNDCDGWYRVGSGESSYTIPGSSVWVSWPSKVATVSSSTSCGQNGTNGWCIGSGSVSISGNDPLSGYTVTGIEGTLNGSSFFCSGNSCVVAAQPGTNAYSFWALSSFGDTSSKGSANIKMDNDLPSISGSHSGTLGNNSWYIGNVSATASGSDATSGLNALQISSDGGSSWGGSSLTISSDGYYDLQYRAIDNAGQTASTGVTSIKVDVTNPAIAPSVSGTAGSGGWYTSDVTVYANASDATSGLNAVQMQVDGAGWQSTTDVGLSEGTYTVAVQALDNADNFNSASLGVKVDTTAPGLVIDVTGDTGANGWYTSPSVTVNASASDATSGVVSLQMQTDGGGYSSTTAQTVSGEGTHNVETTSSDAAGNTSSDSRTIKIDTQSPSLSLTSHSAGSSQLVTEMVIISGTANDTTSGLDKVTLIVDGEYYTVGVNGNGEWQLNWDSTSAKNGPRSVEVVAIDMAGHNSDRLSFTLNVENEKPYITLPKVCIQAGYAMSMKIGPGSNPLAGSELEIEGETHELGKTPPDSFTWTNAPSTPDNYILRVKAWDTAGNTTIRTACFVVLVSPIPAPTEEPVTATGGVDGEGGSNPDGGSSTSNDPSDNNDDGTGNSGTDDSNDNDGDSGDSGGTVESLADQVADTTAPPTTTTVEGKPFVAMMASYFNQASTNPSNVVWGGAAIAAAAAMTAYNLDQKRRREAAEAAERRRKYLAAKERREAGDAGMTDEEIMAQIIAVGGDPNMPIAQARAIIGNARVANLKALNTLHEMKTAGVLTEEEHAAWKHDVQHGVANVTAVNQLLADAIQAEKDKETRASTSAKPDKSMIDMLWEETQSQGTPTAVLQGQGDLDKWYDLQMRYATDPEVRQAVQHQYEKMKQGLIDGTMTSDDINHVYMQAYAVARSHAKSQMAIAYNEINSRSPQEIMANKWRERYEGGEAVDPKEVVKNFMNFWGRNEASNIADETTSGLISYGTDWENWQTRLNWKKSGNISVSGSNDDAGRAFLGLTGGAARKLETIQESIKAADISDKLKWIDFEADTFLGRYGGPLFTTLFAGILNGWDAFTDENLDVEDKWQHFLLGTSIDVTLDYFVGIGAAWITTSFLAPALLSVSVAAGIITAGATLPVVAIMAIVVVVAMGLGILLDGLGVTDMIKNNINNYVDWIQGERESLFDNNKDK